MRSLDIPYQEFQNHPEQVERKFIEIGRVQIEQEGAQLIVEGGMGIFSNLSDGTRGRLQDILDIQILEATGIVIKTMEMFISLNISHSKRTYPSPPIDWRP